MARFFVNETRRSSHRFKDVVEEDVYLIYNDDIVFSGKHASKHQKTWADQVYVFPPWEEYAEELEDRRRGNDKQRAV